MEILKEGKVTLCYPNYVNNALVAGGNWETTLPVGNIKTPYFSEVARSVDTNIESTKMTIQMSRFQPLFMVALANHNLSAGSKWRVRVFREKEGLMFYDSGELFVWPQVYATSELEWEYDNFWLGTIDENERDSFTPLTTHFFPESFVGTYIEIDIIDQGNSDEYVKIGRVMVADAWQPKRSASYGIQYGYDIATTFENAIDEGMTEYADKKIPKRTVSFDLNRVTAEEGFSKVQRINRNVGLDGEILYTEFGPMNEERFAKTFIGRQVSINPLTHPYYQNYATGFQLKEIL